MQLACMCWCDTYPPGVWSSCAVCADTGGGGGVYLAGVGERGGGGPKPGAYWGPGRGLVGTVPALHGGPTWGRDPLSLLG